MRVIVWHNLLWSRYKGVVWTELHHLAGQRGVELEIIQIAETESDRAVLSPVDLSWHQYPFKLLFKGAYSQIPKRRLYATMANETLRSKADLTLLAGYNSPEHWMQAFLLMLRRRKFALFCDSTLYDNPQTPLKGIAKRFIFSRANAIFCYGQRAREYLQHYGVPSEKIFHRNQTAALPPDYSRDAVLARRAKEAAPSAAPRYLYVGRLSPEKSIDTLIEAFALVRTHEPAATLVIVGRGPEEARLKALADKLSLGGSINFAGSKFDDALVAEYLAATCLVLPSKSEPWGLVVNEALSYGCPVIVSHRCGCVPELVIDGKTGYVFEWGNTGQMAEKMLSARDTFRDVAASAANCIQHIGQYTPQNAASAILEGVVASTRHK
jgi:glycosyltransferase involved in cell wall biosynthesis